MQKPEEFLDLCHVMHENNPIQNHFYKPKPKEIKPTKPTVKLFGSYDGRTLVL